MPNMGTIFISSYRPAPLKGNPLSLSQRPGRLALGWHPRNPVGKGQ